MYLSFAVWVPYPAAVWEIILHEFSCEKKGSHFFSQELAKYSILGRDGIHKEVDSLKNIGFTRTIWSWEYVFMPPRKQSIRVIFEGIEGKGDKHDIV